MRVPAELREPLHAFPEMRERGEARIVVVQAFERRYSAAARRLRSQKYVPIDRGSTTISARIPSGTASQIAPTFGGPARSGPAAVVLALWRADALRPGSRGT